MAEIPTAEEVEGMSVAQIPKEYLLTCLMEEAGEIVQRASKMSRFGAREIQQGQSLCNEHRLALELTDLIAVAFALGLLDRRDLKPTLWLETAIESKNVKLLRYYIYSCRVNTPT